MWQQLWLGLAVLRPSAILGRSVLLLLKCGLWPSITTCGLAEDAESQSHLRPVLPGDVWAPGGWRAAALDVNDVAILVCLILVKKLQLFKSRGIWLFTLHFQCLIFFVLFFNGMFLMKCQFSGVSGGLKWGSPGAWFEDLRAGSASL